MSVYECICVYLNVCDCYEVFDCIWLPVNVISVFEHIWMYLSVFECMWVLVYVFKYIHTLTLTYTQIHSNALKYTQIDSNTLTLPQICYVNVMSIYECIGVYLNVCMCMWV